MIGRSFLAGLVAVALLPLGGSAFHKTEQGNQRYLEGRYEDALRLYTEAQVELPDAPELYYDIGNVLDRQHDFDGAAEAFSRTLLSAPPDLVAPAAYNLGNARFRQQDYQAAVEAYQQVLQVDPDDRDAKRNLEIALRALEEQQQQQEQAGDDEEQPQDPPPPEETAEEQQDPEEQQTPEEPAEPEQGEQPQEQEGQMTPEQAARMLDGLEEQELDNLRRQALRPPRPSERTAGEDW